MIVVGLIGQTSVFSQVSLHWRGQDHWHLAMLFFYHHHHHHLSTRAGDMTRHRAGSQLNKNLEHSYYWQIMSQESSKHLWGPYNLNILIVVLGNLISVCITRLVSGRLDICVENLKKWVKNLKKCVKNLKICVQNLKKSVVKSWFLCKNLKKLVENLEKKCENGFKIV